jgi:hypothetical protein
MSKNDGGMISSEEAFNNKIELDYKQMPSPSSSTHKVETSTQSLFSVLPRSLPDIDDNSMNHVFEYMESYEQDIAWSYLSDSLFITGGLLYVFISMWDVIRPTEDDRNYYYLDVLAPTVYLLNSVIDVEWANRVRRRVRVKKDMTQSWEDWRSGLALSMDPSANLVAEPLPWYHRIRKHAAHRRTILAALTFGIAAFFGVGSAMMCYRDDEIGLWGCDKLDAAADHIYVISAVITITGKRVRPWLVSASSVPIYNNPEMLEDLGDMLFFLGSMLDVILGDLNVDNVPIGCVVSSFLWLTDACFYLRSDVVMARRVKDKNVEDSGSMLV